jgi:membrane-associated phospholipid phosphatase
MTLRSLVPVCMAVAIPMRLLAQPLAIASDPHRTAIEAAASAGAQDVRTEDVVPASDHGSVTGEGAALDDQPAAPPPPPPHTGIRALLHNVVEDITKLPSMPNVYIAAVGGGLALAAHPADPTLNARLGGHWNAFFAPGKYIGGTAEQVAMSLGTFAFGRLMDQPKVSHLGNDLLQAQIISELIIEPLKLATQRLRPYQTGHCRLNCSFPSGHASVTFADATVIERHLGWKYSVIGYAIAAYVATSRLHDNDHFVSDVVFGAATGTIAGRTVVHHARDYWAFTPAPLPGGGLAILVSRTTVAR